MLQSQAFFTALAATAALYMPVMLAFWFAPPLAAWHSTGAVKALFFSLAASLMNWRAFLGYGAVTAIVNGKVWTADPRRIPLTAHAQIQLEVGTPLVAPERIRFPGAF